MRFKTIYALLSALLVKADFELRGRRRVLQNPGSALSLHKESIHKTQIDALYEIFVATKMDADISRPLPEHNWFLDDTNSSSRDYCNFTGVSCDIAGNVTALDLDETMSGTLPDAFSALSGLKRLRLFNNSVHGTIPHSLLNLTDLSHLNLGHNLFSGEFPDLSGLPSLTRLILDRNALSGTLPDSLCKLTRLETLEISAVTKMSNGQIPTCLGRLGSLTKFRLTDVGLTGTIPVGLCGRDMNGISPNPFGCNAIGCPAGYFQRTLGRQTNLDAPCKKCDVPSNVIGSTTCQWHQPPEETTSPSVSATQNGTVSPSSIPTTIVLPSLSPQPSPSEIPSSYFSNSTSSSSPLATSAPTTEPNFRDTSLPSTPTTETPVIRHPSASPNVLLGTTNISGVPSGTSSSQPTVYSIPSSQPSTSPSLPSGRDNTFNGITAESPSNNDEKRVLYPSIAVALIALFALVALLVWKRNKRNSATPHMPMDDDTSERTGEGAKKTPSTIATNEVGEALAPQMTRQKSILKTSLLKETGISKAPLPTIDESSPKVRFDLPDQRSMLPSGGHTGSKEEMITKEDDADESREAWMTWIMNSKCDPFNVCSTPCGGRSTSDPECGAAISFDSSVTSLSPMLPPNEMNSSDPDPVTSLVEEFEEIELDDCVLGIRDRSSLSDGRVLVARSNVDSVFRPTSHRERSAGSANGLDDEIYRHYSIGKDMVEL